MVAYAQPRRVRISDSDFIRFSTALNQMGIGRQEIRVVGDDGSRVLVHPDDLLRPVEGPVGISMKIVRFLELEE